MVLPKAPYKHTKKICRYNLLNYIRYAGCYKPPWLLIFKIRISTNTIITAAELITNYYLLSIKGAVQTQFVFTHSFISLNVQIINRTKHILSSIAIYRQTKEIIKIRSRPKRFGDCRPLPLCLKILFLLNS